MFNYFSRPVADSFYIHFLKLFYLCIQIYFWPIAKLYAIFLWLPNFFLKRKYNWRHFGLHIYLNINQSSYLIISTSFLSNVCYLILIIWQNYNMYGKLRTGKWVHSVEHSPPSSPSSTLCNLFGTAPVNGSPGRKRD